MPLPLKVLAGLIAGQMNPSNPLMSPLFGDLQDLPPTLVQASDREMLLDDAIRYVNKARARSSPVTLQVWPDMVHVWQMFQHVLPEARYAIDEVAAFIEATRVSVSIDEASSG
jgi:acetyl esterase/lipase